MEIEEVMGYLYGSEQPQRVNYSTKGGKKITDVVKEKTTEDQDPLKAKYWENNEILTSIINSSKIRYSTDTINDKSEDITKLPKPLISKLQRALSKLYQQQPDNENVTLIGDEELRLKEWNDGSHSLLIAFQKSQGFTGNGILDRKTMLALDSAYALIEEQIEFEIGKFNIQTDEGDPIYYWEPGNLYNSKQEHVWQSSGEFDEEIDDFSKQTTLALEELVKYFGSADRLKQKMGIFMKGGKAQDKGLKITYDIESMANGSEGVMWNPYMGIYLANQDLSVPPFIILYHEIVHSFLTYQMGGATKKEAFFDKIGDSDPICKTIWNGDAEEREVVERHEAPLAKISGFAVRTSYGGTGHSNDYLSNDIWENNPSDPGSGELTKQFVQPEFKYRTTNPLKHVPAKSEIKPIEIARQLYLAGKDKNILIYKFETETEGREPGIYLYKIKEQIWQLLLPKTFRNPNTQD